jgi:hypothetical protein
LTPKFSPPLERQQLGRHIRGVATKFFSKMKKFLVDHKKENFKNFFEIEKIIEH